PHCAVGCVRSGDVHRAHGRLHSAHALGPGRRGRDPGGRVRRSVGSRATGRGARVGPARGARGAPTVGRRSFLRTGAAVALGGGVLMPRAKQPHIAVIGAGAFGGWTALFLQRRGARVTLVDAWGPGNSRASSGGETRVIRATYGPRAVYTR